VFRSRYERPEDCGKNQGNAKSTDPIFVNDWLFAGMAGNGLSLDCTPETPILAESCEIFGVKTGTCADGKPTALVFEYTGEGCVDGNDQAADKWSCSGDPFFAEPIQVVMMKDADKIAVAIRKDVDGDGQIDVGDTFEIRRTDGREFAADTLFNIVQNGNVLQALKFHTSCSQPLNVGDQFGSVILRQFIPKGSTLPTENVIYTYLISNKGPFSQVVDVMDDKLGSLASGLLVPADQTVKITKPALLTEPGTVKNVVTVTDVDDPACWATDEVTVHVVEPPASCADGKPTALVFDYLGDGCSATSNLQGGKFVCTETGPLGDLSDVVMTKDPGKFIVEIVGNKVKIAYADPVGKEFPSEIKYQIIGKDGTQSHTLHTSCSQPLNVGDQFGALFLEKFIPKY
jgi:hypothetical protein